MQKEREEGKINQYSHVALKRALNRISHIFDWLLYPPIKVEWKMEESKREKEKKKKKKVRMM